MAGKRRNWDDEDVNTKELWIRANDCFSSGEKEAGSENKSTTTVFLP